MTREILRMKWKELKPKIASFCKKNQGTKLQ